MSTSFAFRRLRAALVCVAMAIAVLSSLASCSGPPASPQANGRSQAPVVDSILRAFPAAAPLLDPASSCPARWLAPSGSWMLTPAPPEPDIPATAQPLEAMALRAMALRAAPLFTVQVPGIASDPVVLDLPRARLQLRIRKPAAAPAAGRSEHGAVVFPAVFPGVDTVLTAARSGVEELWRLASPRPVEYAFDLPHDLRLRQASPRTVEVMHHAAAVLRISAPVAWDSDGREIRPSVQLENQLIRILLPEGLRYPVLVDPYFETTDRMDQGRAHHAAVLMASGKVLLAGGCHGNCDPVLDTAEIFDPQRYAFSTVAARMTRPRHSLSGVLLADGRVLLAGGCEDGSCTIMPQESEIFDPAEESFTIGPSMVAARRSATAVRLRSGKVLFAGGFAGDVNLAPLSSAEIYDAALAAFVPAGAMTSGRGFHTATLLPTGAVLVAGGVVSTSSVTASAELFDPVTATFHVTAGAMSVPRAHHAATATADGRVLVSGGCTSKSCSSVEATAEVFDPAAGGGLGAFTPVPQPMRGPHRDHISMLLPTGRILVAGGMKPGSGGTTSMTSEAELFDPQTLTFAATDSMIALRRFASATMMPTGRVLIAGGFGTGDPLPSVEDYDPFGSAAASQTHVVSAMNSPRIGHTATLLPHGKVLLAGGVACTSDDLSTGCYAPIAQTEIFDPATNTFTPAGTMLNPRVLHRATLMADGRVLFTGGCDNPLCAKTILTKGPITTAEIYDSATGQFSLLAAHINVPRVNHTATTLADGRVLLAGGCTEALCASSDATADAEVFQPTTQTFTPVGKMSRARGGHTATLLDTGRVVVIGGRDDQGSVDVTEVFDPATDSFEELPGPADFRTGHASLLVPSGDLLLAGGLGPAGTTAIVNSAEYYDPRTGSSSPTYFMSVKRFWLNDALIPLISGKAFVSGGCADFTGCSDAQKHSTELFNPSFNYGLGAFFPAASMSAARSGHTMTRLPNGSVLIAGGCDTDVTLPRLCVGDVVEGTAELFSDTPQALAARPTITDVPASVTIGTPVNVTGTGLQSMAGGGVGTSGSGDANHPVALWFPNAGGYPLVSAMTSFTDTSAIWHVPMTARLGGGWLHVVVHGMASPGVYVTLRPAPVGASCSVDPECATGWCRDGVCCSTDCRGTCEACSAAKKGGGADGDCGPIPDGLDPDDECEQQPVSTCQQDGTCDGGGHCRLYAAGTPCTDPSCKAGQYAGQGKCDGEGTCKVPASQPCAPGICTADETSCSLLCSVPEDCADGAFCNAGVCASKRTQGTPCTDSQECLSGFCVDSVCCDAPCIGQCQACDNPGSVGTCAVVQGAPHGNRPRCDGDDPRCAGTCDGEHGAACRYPGLETACGEPSCSDGVARSSACQGNGHCAPRPDDECAPYACGDTTCRQSCASSRDCAAGAFCDVSTSRCTLGAYCLDRETHVDVNGRRASCTPYTCSAGSCRASCVLTSDCAAGYVCDREAQSCIPREAVPAGDSGCGCMTAGDRVQRSAAWAWLCGILLAWAARNRRRRRLDHARLPSRHGSPP